MEEEIQGFIQKKANLERDYEEVIMKNYGAQIHWGSEKWKVEKLRENIIAIKTDLSLAMKQNAVKSDLKRICMDLYHRYRDLQEAPPTSVPREVLPHYTESELVAALEAFQNDKKLTFEHVQIIEPSDKKRYREQLEKTIMILQKEEKKRTIKRRIEQEKMLEEGVILTKYGER
jgi:hypothetical protein